MTTRHLMLAAALLLAAVPALAQSRRAGLRLDSGSGIFRFLVNSQWLDFGGSYGSSNVVQYRIDFGTKF